MKIKYMVAILIATFFNFFSQAQIKVDLNRPNFNLQVNPEFNYNPESTNNLTIKVLAVMVDFVEDNDERTTGNGKFNLSRSDSIIDSPPHNKEYFENHLLFLKSYWGKVTNGKIIIDYIVLDSVFHLPNQMKYYSPPKKSTTFAEIGYLIEDTWKIVDSLYPDFPFEMFDAFIIFHAGTGRDVDLTSIYGYDPTPYDIPTLFMNLNNLKQIFGYDYKGVKVKNGNYFINNSLVIPSTENRKISTVGGTTLLQLSINGILTGTFGSYLGLPDLFNTKTGRTAIGRFGLMDGQSMFSWSGLFPPEPSAWEKYFLEKKYNLGFLKIVEIDSSTKINLPAVGFSGTDTIYKVNINAREYYLIENRNRDANRDGAKVKFVHNGLLIEKNFQYDTDKFNYLNQREIFGVLVDIDEPDWSLPGGVTKDGKFFDGGVLIWHIDENVIENNLATNTINADPRRRGVDLEEADGSQDLGQSYGFLSPGSGSEDGTSLDFWFLGNSAPVYKNEFSLNSYPNTLSNDLARSHITIKNFTQRSPLMQAEVLLGSDIIKPIVGFPKKFSYNQISQPPQIYNKKIFITNGDSVFAFLMDGRSATRNPDGLFLPYGGKFPPAIFEENSFVLVDDTTISIIQAIDNDSDLIFDSILVVYEYHNDSKFTTPASIQLTSSLTNPLNIFLGDEQGNVHMIRNLNLIYDATKLKISTQAITDITINDAFIIVSSVDSIKIISYPEGFKLPRISNEWILASAYRSATHPDFVVSAEKNGDNFMVIDLSSNTSQNFILPDGKIVGLAIADIDDNNSRDIIITAGNKLFAYNYKGITLDNFPVILPDSAVSSPMIADVNGDDVLDVLILCKNNLLTAYSGNGRIINDFPVSISTGALSNLCISNSGIENEAVMTATTPDGYLYAWHLPLAKDIVWGNFKGNLQHTAFENFQMSGTIINEYFPSKRAYNWPNPVYGDKTNIRFYVSENSNVTIKIFDLSGTLIDEIKTAAIGGIDNEVLWNVANIQSGIYYAYIKSESAANSGSALIKIAVIK